MLFKKLKFLHSFHLVDGSPWPFLLSLNVLGLAFGFLLVLHKHEGGLDLFFLSLILCFVIFILWWRDVIREGTFLWCHTKNVQKNLRFGMILFILSEIMFFFSFFWAFFHSSLVPSYIIGGVWPPFYLILFSSLGIPLVNTVLLLTSGLTVTMSHYFVRYYQNLEKNRSLFYLFLTILLAFLFLFLQFYEYCAAFFTISDGIYGSLFYLLTGFHGFHVLIGTFFLLVCFFRLLFNHFFF